MDDNIKADVVTEDTKDTKKEDEPKKEELEKEEKYIGQALNTIEKNGKVKIYSKKDTKSEVIHVLKDLDKVQLLETLPYGWFKVKLENGNIGYADARYIRTNKIPPHKFNKNRKGYTLIFTHEDQTLRIYKDGQLVRESLASSGLWDTFTPKGIFQIEDGRRGKWFYAKRFEQGGKYWVGFKGSYLFHSIPCDKDGNIIEEEARKIGQPASHGCIRLPLDIARYIYENVPDGALVLIY